MAGHKRENHQEELENKKIILTLHNPLKLHFKIKITIEGKKYISVMFIKV